MGVRRPLSFVFGILILGTLGFSQDAFADPLTLFHTTFVDSFSIAAQETEPTGVAFSSDGAKMFVVGSSTYLIWRWIAQFGQTLADQCYLGIVSSICSQHLSEWVIILSCCITNP